MHTCLQAPQLVTSVKIDDTQPGSVLSQLK